MRRNDRAIAEVGCEPLLGSLGRWRAGRQPMTIINDHARIQLGIIAIRLLVLIRLCTKSPRYLLACALSGFFGV